MTLLPKNLKYLRERDGLKQAQVSILLGFNRSTWNNYETGKSQPNLDDFIKISKYFRRSASELLEIDLTDVHLNENTVDHKNEGNVHLNVHPDVHLNVETARFFNDIHKRKGGATKAQGACNDMKTIIKSQEKTINALEALNSMLQARVAFLEQENDNLKREIPEIGKSLGDIKTNSG